MTFFQWDKRYDIGVADMNCEHQKLIGIMNRLHELYTAKAGKEATRKVVEHLVEYTKLHFAHEEAYMDQIRFPERHIHQLVHKDLLAKLEQHKQAFEKKGLLTDDFFSFLKRWLAAHILGIDTKYAAHAGHHQVGAGYSHVSGANAAR